MLWPDLMHCPLTTQRFKSIDEASFIAGDSTQIEIILDVIISNYAPQCYPLVKRTLPANVIYLLARYAAYRCQDQEDLLHCVLEGASIAIEEVSHVSRRAEPAISDVMLTGLWCKPEWGRFVANTGILDLQYYDLDPPHSIGPWAAECLRAKRVVGDAARNAELHAGWVRALCRRRTTMLKVLLFPASTHHSLHGRQNAPDPGSVHARLRNHRGGCAV
jgi:hypothetical protein